MIVNFNVYENRKSMPYFNGYGDFDRLKPEITKLLSEGLNCAEIGRRINKEVRWVHKALVKYKLLTNTAQKRLSPREKVEKLYHLGKSEQDIASYLDLPIDVVHSYCGINVKSSKVSKAKEIAEKIKQRQIIEKQIVELYDNGCSFDGICSKYFISDDEVKHILNKNGRHTEKWLNYTSKLEDKTLGRIANKLKIPYEELIKSVII